jgi:hypothetical protein
VSDENTVSKALDILREDGLLSLGRSTKRFVIRNTKSKIKDLVYSIANSVTGEQQPELEFLFVSDLNPTIDCTVEYYIDNSVDFKKYYRVVNDKSVTFSPDTAFTQIAFDLLGVDSVNSAFIKATFHHRDGSVTTKTTQFSNGDLFERRDIPLKYTLDEPAEHANIEVSSESDGSSGRNYISFQNSTNNALSEPRISVPQIEQTTGPDVPIFFISVDTLRYDHLDCLSSTLDEFEEATIPTEPRTQGVCTWPSHASMFTGVHPGTHGCQARSTSLSIQESLITLPEYLEQLGYTNSACVGTGNLRPDSGFMRGFHRFNIKTMDWKRREFDSESNVDTVAKWLTNDDLSSKSKFYFLHVFDPHYPYYPPLPITNTETIDYKLTDRIPRPSTERNYISLLNEDPLDISAEDLDVCKSYYRESIQYVDTQISRLIKMMKDENVFEEALIIITGDHGEDFYERNFLYHHSLYDTNIRPPIVIKPPNGDDFEPPDSTDLIDIFPTITQLLGDDIPEQVEGRSWTSNNELRPRITERFLEHYNVSVEIDGVKGIFTYEENGPNRPSPTQIEEGPIKKEFYELEQVRSGEIKSDNTDISDNLKSRLEHQAQQFIKSSDEVLEQSKQEPREDVKKHLEDMGYI